ncbi:serine/threonine-protein kinase LMTK1 isoform X2 [Synchiropus splendidus]|uniref:serine/threonine-protein kinase LMTK1 isoform X2 n=1 Tax=Synchiropus splendidus TaxID=270530 RepID=UPI00237EB93B|nr:serine/threonine-protein kinase LMTK1 isoform X2 [Synchiropus splendidus]
MNGRRLGSRLGPSALRSHTPDQYFISTWDWDSVTVTVLRVAGRSSAPSSSVGTIVSFWNMRIQGVQLLKSSDLGRHSLLYLKDIGHGWFGKVLLGEVNMGLSTTQVVVKELKASASVQEQMQFLEEVQPYRTLQHPALLQCLAQCSEVTPYLLVMEFCPLGDLKSYLSGCRLTDSETPDPLVLQRMACDVASGLLHLHKNNFIHNDLALRNCLLTSEMTVKIGDYGLSHSRYKEDYYVTPDQIWVPLRWIAPELIDEVHGNLLLVDQTKSSNIWSLGVTVWELFELGNQPYRLYSDRQVLTYAVKEQQLKLPKPQMQFPLVERWYEVMQFCWLQPELRPSSEEVHLLVTYLCAKGSSEAEEDFEQRWNTLKPNLLGSATHTSLILTPTAASTDGTRQTSAGERASSASSSFPLLDHFSDSYQSDTGDDLLTVTETSHGLNFEYKWEEARAEQPYCSSSTSGPLGQGNPHYQDIYYSSKGSPSEGCKGGSLSSSVSPSYYESEHPSVVPVLSAHSPSVSSEYYIRIEETADCSINMDDHIEDYSPSHEASNSRSSSESGTAAPPPQPIAYWSTANNTQSTSYDSDTSPTVQLTTAPLLRRSSNTSLTKLSHSHDSSSRQTDYCEPQCSSKPRTRQPEMESSPANASRPTGQSENLSSSHAVSSPSLGFCDPYLEASDTCRNKVDPLEKTLPVVNHVSVDLGTDDSLLVSQEANHELLDEVTHWTSNRSANNNILSFDSRHSVGCNYLDLHYDPRAMWSLTKATTKTFHNIRSVEAEGAVSGSDRNPSELGSYIYLCPKDRETLHSEPKMVPEPIHVNSPSFKEPKERAGELASSGLRDQQLPYQSSSEREEDVSFRARGIGLGDLGICSEDEEDDIADITSGLFADFNLDFAEDEELSPLKNLGGTPVSTDAFTLSMESPSDQAFSPDPFPLLPKSLDSGYDTENNASPEFIFREFEDFQESYGSQTLEEESGTLQHVRLAQGFSKRAAELKLTGQTEKNPYRDSAYFSESENEKTPREEGTRFFSSDCDVHADRCDDALIQREVKCEQLKMCHLWEGDQSSNRLDSAPALSMLAPFPAQMGGCLTKESAPAENNLDLETEHSGEEQCTELSAESESASGVQEASANCEDGNKAGDSCCAGHFSSSDSTLDDYREENGERSTEEEEIPEFNHVPEETEDRGKSLINGEDFEDIDAEECDSQDSLCEESNGHVDLSSSSSLLELCGENVRAPLEEAEDEDDSDDSESDEELRIYNIQEEESEESEEDLSTVPVVVSDCSSASHLRSLLKMPSVISQSFCDELERKKKAVSFFDDVTVFLFDQESPTGELADYTFSNCGESSKPPEGTTSNHQLQPVPQLEVRSCVTVSKVLDHSEAGGGCEFEDPSVEPCPPSPDTISEPTPSPTAPDSPKPADVALNRFVVSRFSITHVSDADTGKATGNSEDEPKE